MASHSHDYTSATAALFNAQLAAFSSMANIMVQGTQKIVALNIATVKESANEVSAKTRDLLAAKDPQAFMALASERSQPNAEKLADYNHHLSDILMSTKDEFVKVVDIQTAEVQHKMSEFMHAIVTNGADEGGDGKT